MSSHPNDKPVGIATMAVQFVCHVPIALIGMSLGAVIGAFGGAAATSGQEGVAAGAALGLAGGLVFIAAAVYMGVALLGVAAGYGILQGRKWGFTLGLIGSVAHVILGVMNGVGGNPTGWVGFLLACGLAYYCWARLNGKMGSTPA